MGLISKEDLFYDDYSWTVVSGDNPKVTGKPDRDLLNRKEGYEVLDFINKFCKDYNLKKKASANKVEKMIRDEVPSIIHSQEKIVDWIYKNWKTSKFQ